MAEVAPGFTVATTGYAVGFWLLIAALVCNVVEVFVWMKYLKENNTWGTLAASRRVLQIVTPLRFIFLTLGVMLLGWILFIIGVTARTPPFSGAVPEALGGLSILIALIFMILFFVDKHLKK